MTAVQIPGYVVGAWDIDPVHSDVSFTAKHMAVSKVRGNFTEFSGRITTAENPLDSTVEATIQMASITTGNDGRDDHVRSGDFFEVETHPTMTYRSTSLEADGEDFVLHGELTLKGVTKEVPLKLEVNGFGPDAYGGTRAGFTATGQINRKDFGVNFNGVIEGTGGLVVSDKIQIALEIEGVLAQA